MLQIQVNSLLATAQGKGDIIKTAEKTVTQKFKNLTVWRDLKSK